MKSITAATARAGTSIRHRGPARSATKPRNTSSATDTGTWRSRPFSISDGRFSEDEAAALGVSYASVTAGLARATKMITKSPLESVGIPTKEANAVGIRASKFVVNLLHEQEFIKNEAYLEEYHQIRKEVDCLLGHVFILGRGDLAVGAVEAFRNGTIDIPFAPSNTMPGNCVPRATGKPTSGFWNSGISVLPKK